MSHSFEPPRLAGPAGDDLGRIALPGPRLLLADLMLMRIAPLPAPLPALPPLPSPLPPPGALFSFAVSPPAPPLIDGSAGSEALESTGVLALWPRKSKGRPGPGRSFGFLGRVRCSLRSASVPATNLLSPPGVFVGMPAAEWEW